MNTLLLKFPWQVFIGLLLVLRVGTLNECVPGYAKIFTDKGLRFDHQQSYKEAVTNYKKAIHHNPEYSLAYFYLGEIYHKLNQRDEMLKNFQKIVELNVLDFSLRHYHRAYFEVGLDLYLKKEYLKAISLFRKAVYLYPLFGPSFYYMGASFIELGDIENALMTKTVMNFYSLEINLNEELDQLLRDRHISNHQSATKKD